MTVPVDTLVVDTARLAAWKADSDFDYAREFVQSDTSVIDWLLTALDHWMMKALHISLYSQTANILWACVGLAAVAAIVAIFVYRHPQLFLRSGRRPIDYEVEEDNIYGVDFEADIAAALQRANYYAAIRLVYLQTLRRLSDGGCVVWMPSKTPSQYAREWPSDDFRWLSQQFLRIRYGGYKADEALFLSVRDRQKAIFAALDAAEKSKGGEA